MPSKAGLACESAQGAGCADLQQGLVGGCRVCDGELLPEAWLHHKWLGQVGGLTITSAAHTQAHDVPVAQVLQAAAGRLVALLLLRAIPDLHQVAACQQLTGHGLNIQPSFIKHNAKGAAARGVVRQHAGSCIITVPTAS